MVNSATSAWSKVVPAHLERYAGSSRLSAATCPASGGMVVNASTHAASMYCAANDGSKAWTRRYTSNICLQL